MHDFLLGALKALTPAAAAALALITNWIAGSPLDVDTAQTIVVGAIGSLVVYAVPNIPGGGIGGLAKALVPVIGSALVIPVNHLFGDPLDVDALRALAAGAVTSIVVYLVPNLRTDGPQESAAGVQVE